MDLITILYLGDIVNGLGVLAFLVATFGVIATVIMLCASADSRGDEKTKALKMVLKMGLATLVAILLAILVPSKQTLYAMAAVKYGQELAKNERVQGLGDKVLKILEQKLDQTLDDGKTSKKDDSK